MIISFLGQTVKDYHEKYPILLNLITPICPICHGKCHAHCWYDRKVRGPDPTVIKILRVKCTHCGSTHAVLPDFLHPKGRYSEPVREETIVSCEIKEKTGEAASETQSVQTTRRWIKRYRETIGTIVTALQSVLARLGVYETNSGLETLIHICAKIEMAIGRVINGSCIFGKVNILLSWEAMGLWI